jgi:hypothetical protein
VDGRDRMLVDDLRSVAPNKLDRVAVERPDMTLEPDAVRQKDGDFNSVIAKVLREHVLIAPVSTFKGCYLSLPGRFASRQWTLPRETRWQQH